MEEELKCAVCSRFFCNPVLLPCCHSLCAVCAAQNQEPVQQLLPAQPDEGAPEGGGGGGGDTLDVDKLSIVSETDSGVVCNSRPNSYVGTPSIGSIFLHATQGAVYGLRCPVCKKTIFFDEHGAQALPKNRVLESMVEKYGENHSQVTVKCQLCEGDQSTVAAVMCEQCEIFYCDTCRDSCHPARGPLAKHNLVDPTQGKSLLRTKNKNTELKCTEHGDEHLSMYCMLCKLPVCYVCAQEGRHINHDVQALGVIFKSQKNELSQNLQLLSEKAKSGTVFIQRLKSMADQVEGNCMEFETTVVAQCDELIEAVKQRKQELMESIKNEKLLKIQTLKEQVSHCTCLLQRTTGLLQYSIEVLKESDLFSFLQISGALINRVSTADVNFNKEMELAPRVSPEFELTLDNSTILHAIKIMNFFQMKDGIVAPGQPTIIPEDCSAENNSVTISWQPHPSSLVEAYTLELDDGNSGDFRVVYVGRETICTVDGLHFNSIYNARVKAHNHAGESAYSELVSLQTAELAWFNLDQTTAPLDVMLSNNNQTVTCNSFDHKVVLGCVGFSKGVHYWEISIDRYDKHTDLAFGIARFDVEKGAMLGQDNKAWSMYIDHQRSWFYHCNRHTNRTEGGIKNSSVVGVLLDLNHHTLSYFLDEEPHGPVAFSELHGVFFPAISINRSVQVTLHTGIAPPVESEIEGE